MDIPTFPVSASPASHHRYALARKLVDQCPPELGQEIALAGSAGWGVADPDSDIDLNLWAEQIPTVAQRFQWLQAAGATDCRLDAEPGATDATGIVCRFHDVWVDIGWELLDQAQCQKKIEAMLAGEVLDHGELLLAWNLVHYWPLRTTGLLRSWQQQLRIYPDVVQQRFITASTTFWTFPHRVNMLWTLARRQELLALDRWLYADLEDALRILFTLNRQWEPDWKQLHHHVRYLTIMPDQLIERVHSATFNPHPNQRIAHTMQLALKILALVPPPYDVTQAQATLHHSLQQHLPDIRPSLGKPVQNHRQQYNR